MIEAWPSATPVTNPELISTVATLLSLLLQAPVPPESTTAFALYVAVAPIQSGLLPLTVPAEAGVQVIAEMVFELAEVLFVLSARTR